MVDTGPTRLIHLIGVENGTRSRAWVSVRVSTAGGPNFRHTQVNVSADQVNISADDMTAKPSGINGGQNFRYLVRFTELSPRRLAAVRVRWGDAEGSAACLGDVPISYLG
jgi:hypothetical protein